MSAARGDTLCLWCNGRGLVFHRGDALDCAHCHGEGLDYGAPRYTRPNTGNHPDHPPVEGGYRGDR